MVTLQDIDAKVCLTASGCLIHQKRVLLVKHKKLGCWLCSGGHVDPNELPHHAAEREFWEETGVKVKAVNNQQLKAHDGSAYLPHPVLSNLHWVCRDNYLVRTKGKKPTTQSKIWHLGCEQHLNFFYVVAPATKSLDFKQNEAETDDIAWFSLSALDEIDLYDNVKLEIETAFKLCPT